MPSSSRYLVTVRRAMSMPRALRIERIFASEYGFFAFSLATTSCTSSLMCFEEMSSPEEVVVLEPYEDDLDLLLLEDA